MIGKEATYKENQFRRFLLLRNPSVKFADKYITYLGGSLIRNAVRDVASVNSIFEITKMGDLLTVYGIVKADSNNVRLHNVYSGVISAYIKFLNDQELRKRVIPSEKDNKE